MSLLLSIYLQYGHANPPYCNTGSQSTITSITIKKSNLNADDTQNIIQDFLKGGKVD